MTMLLECGSLSLCGHLFSFVVLTHMLWNMRVGVCCGNYKWTVLPSLCLEMEVADLHVLANVWGLDREES